MAAAILLGAGFLRALFTVRDMAGQTGAVIFLCQADFMRGEQAAIADSHLRILHIFQGGKHKSCDDRKQTEK